MIKNGKYFLPAIDDGTDFKDLFSKLVIEGAGRPVGKDGLAESSWTPELLSSAISDIDRSPDGVDIRTVQLWFQENTKGIGHNNINNLAKVFGCGDPEEVVEWRKLLLTSQSRLATKRKRLRENDPNELFVSSDHKTSNSNRSVARPRFKLALRTENWMSQSSSNCFWRCRFTRNTIGKYEPS